MLERLKRIWKDEEGQGMVEYGLIIALVAVAVIGALVTLGGNITELFEGIEFDADANQ